MSSKYNRSHNDWHLDTSHKIGKVRLKNKQKSCRDIIELCEIRDGLALYDTLSNDNVCKFIDIFCLRVGITYCNYYYYYYCSPCKHVMYITLYTVFT